MRSVLLYILTFALLAVGTIVSDSYLSAVDLNTSSNTQAYFFKAGTPDGSSANINEVEVLVNAPVFKKNVFAIDNTYFLNLKRNVFKVIQWQYSSLLYSAQLLFLSHGLLLL